jgi:primary-amine oxidase
MFKEEVAKLNIPDGFEVIVEPWPYGGKYSSDLNTIRIFHSMVRFSRESVLTISRSR